MSECLCPLGMPWCLFRLLLRSPHLPMAASTWWEIASFPRIDAKGADEIDKRPALTDSTWKKGGERDIKHVWHDIFTTTLAYGTWKRHNHEAFQWIRHQCKWTDISSQRKEREKDTCSNDDRSIQHSDPESSRSCFSSVSEKNKTIQLPS